MEATTVIDRVDSERVARFYAAGHWCDGGLWDDFAAVARAQPDATALICGDRSLTYRELERRAAEVSARFVVAGISAGSVVLLQGRNSPEAAASFLAVARLGAIAAPVPPMFREQQLRALISQSRAAALVAFADPAVVERAAALRDAIEVVPLALEGNVSALPTSTDAKVDPDELSVLLFSSGTTSEPKGIAHSCNTLRYAAHAIRGRWALGPEDRYLVVCEWGFVGSLVFGYLAALLSGATAVLLPRWDAMQALELIAEQRCSYGLFMPTHSADLLDTDADSRPRTPSMRVWAAPGLAVDRRRAFTEAFGIPLAVYGLSEVPGHAIHGLAEPHEKVVETEGKPLPGTVIRIVGHDGNEVATGVEGDIEVDGPSRFLGFLDNPTLTAEALAPWGGYRTGDRGFLDADGHLVYRGRSKDIIRRGGVTIVPADLEAVIIRHPAVRDVAVVPLPDDRLGERACAAIIVHEGAAAPTLAQLSDFLEADGVSKYTWPEELIVLEDFPRTPSLKVVKRALAEQIIQLLPRQDNANHE